MRASIMLLAAVLACSGCSTTWQRAEVISTAYTPGRLVLVARTATVTDTRGEPEPRESGGRYYTLTYSLPEGFDSVWGPPEVSPLPGPLSEPGHPLAAGSEGPAVHPLALVVGLSRLSENRLVPDWEFGVTQGDLAAAAPRLQRLETQGWERMADWFAHRTRSDGPRIRRPILAMAFPALDWRSTPAVSWPREDEVLTTASGRYLIEIGSDGGLRSGFDLESGMSLSAPLPGWADFPIQTGPTLNYNEGSTAAGARLTAGMKFLATVPHVFDLDPESEIQTPKALAARGLLTAAGSGESVVFPVVRDGMAVVDAGEADGEALLLYTDNFRDDRSPRTRFMIAGADGTPRYRLSFDHRPAGKSTYRRPELAQWDAQRGELLWWEHGLTTFGGSYLATSDAHRLYKWSYKEGVIASTMVPIPWSFAEAAGDAEAWETRNRD